MTLHDMIKDDALTVFCSASDFGETITYYPRVGSSRQIIGVVMRDSTLRDDAGGILNTFEVHVANDGTSGISSTDINLGGDYITLPPRDGKSPTSHTITEILVQDEGMLVLQCR